MKVLWIALLLALAALYLHNAQSYDVQHGFDAYGHLTYLRQVDAGQVPLPNQGWEDYQPPLYYQGVVAIAHALGEPVVATARAVNLAAIWAFCLLTAGVAARFLMLPWGPVAVLAATFPATVTIAPMVHNGPVGMLAAVVGLAWLYALWQRPAVSIVGEAALGLVAGLAFLLRPENLVLTGLVGLLAVARVLRRRADLRDATFALLLAWSVTCTVVAPFVYRNMRHFNRPFVANVDADLYPLPVTIDRMFFPGVHSVAYFLLPPSSLSARPTLATTTSSLWWGTFGTAWCDTLGYFFPSPRPWTEVPLLLAGLVLTAAFLHGAWLARSTPSAWPLLASVALAVFFYVVMNVQLPRSPSVKACYLFPAFAPAAVLTLRGLSRWHRLAPVTACTLLTGLVTWAFWL